MLHVLINSKSVNIIFSRRKKNDDTCGKLEVGSPSFVKYLGSVYLSAIEAIVVCGYTTKFKGNSLSLPVNQQKCYIYYKNYPEWHPVTLFENNVFFEGAFVPWHNKLGIVYFVATKTI